MVTIGLFEPSLAAIVLHNSCSEYGFHLVMIAVTTTTCPRNLILISVEALFQTSTWSLEICFLALPKTTLFLLISMWKYSKFQLPASSRLRKELLELNLKTNICE